MLCIILLAYLKLNPCCCKLQVAECQANTYYIHCVSYIDSTGFVLNSFALAYTTDFAFLPFDIKTIICSNNGTIILFSLNEIEERLEYLAKWLWQFLWFFYGINIKKLSSSYLFTCHLIFFFIIEAIIYYFVKRCSILYCSLYGHHYSNHIIWGGSHGWHDMSPRSSVSFLGLLRWEWQSYILHMDSIVSTHTFNLTYNFTSKSSSR